MITQPRLNTNTSLIERVSNSCDTDSNIYRHVEGMYNPPLSEFVGGMTDELGGSYITEYVSIGSKNYTYHTSVGIHVVKIKCFTLNFVDSQQLTFDVMKEIAILEQEEHIIATESRKNRKV